eukprot:COSAG02_NODE_128_length_34833_cov_44.465221_25_plen_140_part_00
MRMRRAPARGARARDGSCVRVRAWRGAAAAHAVRSTEVVRRGVGMAGDAQYGTIVVAGHLCIDFIPALHAPLDDIARPGGLGAIGEATVRDNTHDPPTQFSCHSVNANGQSHSNCLTIGGAVVAWRGGGQHRPRAVSQL